MIGSALPIAAGRHEPTRRQSPLMPVEHIAFTPNFYTKAAVGADELSLTAGLVYCHQQQLSQEFTNYLLVSNARIRVVSLSVNGLFSSTDFLGPVTNAFVFWIAGNHNHSFARRGQPPLPAGRLPGPAGRRWPALSQPVRQLGQQPFLADEPFPPGDATATAPTPAPATQGVAGRPAAAASAVARRPAVPRHRAAATFTAGRPAATATARPESLSPGPTVGLPTAAGAATARLQPFLG